MAATHYKIFTTDTGGSLRTPLNEDHRQEPLIVIDFISVNAGATVTSDINLEVRDGTNTIFYASSTVDAGTSDTLFISFDGGFPCWKAAASSSDWISTPQQASPVDVIPTFADAGTGICTVGYHFERPTNRR